MAAESIRVARRMFASLHSRSSSSSSSSLLYWLPLLRHCGDNRMTTISECAATATAANFERCFRLLSILVFFQSLRLVTRIETFAQVSERIEKQIVASSQSFALLSSHLMLARSRLRVRTPPQVFLRAIFDFTHAVLFTFHLAPTVAAKKLQRRQRASRARARVVFIIIIVAAAAAAAAAKSKSVVAVRSLARSPQRRLN